MQTIIKRDAIPAVRKIEKNARDVFAVCDLPGFADLASKANNHNSQACTSSAKWYGEKNYRESISQVRNGDLSGVAASDKLLSQIEIAMPMTRAWRVISDVQGGVPCVPSFLAGHPLSMRRRERTMTEQAPLALLCSLELSGSIDVETMRKRGASILALTRLLSNVRPVELWACVSIGEPGYAAHVLVRIDTAPLDLARAAHVLTCPSVTRGLGYACGNALLTDHYGCGEWPGNWAYGNNSVYRKNARDILLSVANPGADALYLVAAHVNDPCVTKPIDWLHKMLAEYGGLDMAA